LFLKDSVFGYIFNIRKTRQYSKMSFLLAFWFTHLAFGTAFFISYFVFPGFLVGRMINNKNVTPRDSFLGYGFGLSQAARIFISYIALSTNDTHVKLSSLMMVVILGILNIYIIVRGYNWKVLDQSTIKSPIGIQMFLSMWALYEYLTF